MGRKLVFDFITDSRFTQNPKKKIQELDVALKRAFQSYSSIVVVNGGEIRRVNFSAHPLSPASYQYRRTYRIVKKGKGMTWNDIMVVVNKVQAPFYKFE